MSPKGLEKTFIDFSNNRFPIETCIKNYFIYGELDLFIEIMNFNDRLEV